MDMLDFFRRILPTEGTYCRFALFGKRNRYFDSIEELVANSIQIDRDGQDTYFAISTFEDDSSRRNTNVHTTKVITIDVDCGDDKPFPTWKEGLAALGAFVKKAKLPPPLIIRSGNGLHTYWVLDRDLRREEWTPLARAMKDAAAGHGFDIDTTKTADPSLVLRPVGSHNYKDPSNPKPVVPIYDGGDTTVEALRKALAYYYVEGNAPVKPRNNGLLDALAVRSEFPPAVGSLVASKCAQIEWAIEHQDQVPEPFWYALIGVAAFCEDPEDTARRWSENHPSYSESATLRKMQQWREQATGPSTCAKFESERPSGCKGCPFAGRIGSPAKLGVRYLEADTSADAPQEAQVDIEIPKPFKRAKDSTGKFLGMAVTIDEADIMLTSFDIYPLSYGYDEHLGYEVAQFMWDRAHVGWKVLTLRQAYLADGTYREFVGAVADQGIVLDTKRQTELFQMMLRSYLNELRKVRTVTNHYSTMGWKEQNKVFVLGDDLYQRHADGKVTKDTIRLAAHVTRAGSDMFTTGGSFDKWKAGTDILRRGNLYAHQYSIGLAFASILMQFSGLKGVTVSLYGESGSGKSQAQYMQQSVWGDPEKLHFQSKFTANSLFDRFGMHGNMPITIDEATQMSDKDMGDYLYWTSQGRDKARLNRSAEARAPREWALISTLSTNKPVGSKLLSGGDEHEAQLARLIELKVEKSPIYRDGTDAGRQLHHLFTENFGWAGRAFLDRLMQLDEQSIRAMIATAMERFPAKYGYKFSGVERFWEVGFVLPDFCLDLTHDWGITAFNGHDASVWATSNIPEMRAVASDNQRDMFDLIAEYMNEHLSETVQVFHSNNASPYVDFSRLPRNSVRVRIDAYRKDNSTDIKDATLLLDRTHFRKWYASKGQNPREVAGALTLEGANATPNSQKASFGKNTTLSIPQTYVIGVDLTHPRMAGVLDDVVTASLEAEARGQDETVVSFKPKA